VKAIVIVFSGSCLRRNDRLPFVPQDHLVAGGKEDPFLPKLL
jgi:hypothetical protein